MPAGEKFTQEDDAYIKHAVEVQNKTFREIGELLERLPSTVNNRYRFKIRKEMNSPPVNRPSKAKRRIFDKINFKAHEYKMQHVPWIKGLEA